MSETKMKFPMPRERKQNAEIYFAENLTASEILKTFTRKGLLTHNYANDLCIILMIYLSKIFSNDRYIYSLLAELHTFDINAFLAVM